jgi:manganese/zinc/iron transport system substrate-binding protein
MLQRIAHILAAVLASMLASMLVSMLVLMLTACDRTPAAGAGGGASTPPERAVPLCVCTTPIVADVVRNVAGDHAEVVALIAPGVDPHLWTPTRTDILRLLEADAVFINGLTLEGRIGDSVARVESLNRPVLRLAQTIPHPELLVDPKRQSYFDPHIWMDPELWGRTAMPVAETLAKIMPRHADEFRSNAAKYAARAAEIERQCARELLSVPAASRTLVTAHDAFGYYGRRFGLEVRGIQGLSTESEASIMDIEQMVAEISSKKIPTAFIETTISERTVRALVEGCNAVGHDLRIGEPLYSDSLGHPGTPEGTWEGMLLHNTRIIARRLGETG